MTDPARLQGKYLREVFLDAVAGISTRVPRLFGRLLGMTSPGLGLSQTDGFEPVWV